MNRLFVLAGVLALCIFGCSGNSTPDVEPVATKGSTPAKPETMTPGAAIPLSTGTTTPPVSGSPTPSGGATALKPGSATPSTPAKSSAKEQAPTAAEGWDPSKENAETLAKTADAKLASLRAASAKVNLVFQDKKGRGTTQCEVSIKDSKTFRIQYPVIGGVKVGLTRSTLIADGQQVATLTDEGLSPKKPVASLKIHSSAPLPDWIFASPEFMFSPITGGHPLTDLVAQAEKMGGGSAVKVEERSFEYKGHMFHQQKIVIGLTPSGAPKIDITILIDKDFGLPVTIDALTSLDKTLSAYHWDAQWNLDPKQKFAADAFVIPYRVQTTKK